MELVDGWDLSAIVRRAKKAGIRVPAGAGAAHDGRGLPRPGLRPRRKRPDGKPLGIVHRDVSPHNVLVSEQGDVKLTDFGIAKALGKRDRTRTGVIKGKLDFMSPEQASGDALAPSSDIFAAGTMLYLLVTDRRPFEGGSDLEVLLKVQRGEFTPLAEVQPDLAPAVVTIVNRAMQRQPADRYPSAEAMMLDIEEVLRSDFGSPGQSELKRWLAELGKQRQGALDVAPAGAARRRAAGPTGHGRDRDARPGGHRDGLGVCRHPHPGQRETSLEPGGAGGAAALAAGPVVFTGAHTGRTGRNAAPAPTWPAPISARASTVGATGSGACAAGGRRVRGDQDGPRAHAHGADRASAGGAGQGEYGVAG